MAKSKSPPPPTPDADLNSCSLQKFRLYETRAVRNPRLPSSPILIFIFIFVLQRFYLIGSDHDKQYYRVLKIDRSEPSDLNISEDLVVYSQQEVKNLLQRISEGNRATGGLSFVGKVYGIAGCIKFLESYYLILVTKRKQIGSICGHAIYSIEESQLITVPHSSIQSDVAHSKTELRIVRSYLLHYGYQDTLNSFDLESENSSLLNPGAQVNGFSEHGDAYALNNRKILRQV